MYLVLNKFLLCWIFSLHSLGVVMESQSFLSGVTAWSTYLMK